jgi:hypothetical protein
MPDLAGGECAQNRQLPLMTFAFEGEDAVQVDYQEYH